MKKTRVAILFLLLTLFAACLPAAAELPAQITLPCEGEDRVHTFIEYVNFGKKHRGRYQCTHCGYKLIPYSPYEDHSGPHLHHRQNLCLMRREIRHSRSRMGRVVIRRQRHTHPQLQELLQS